MAVEQDESRQGVRLILLCRGCEREAISNATLRPVEVTREGVCFGESGRSEVACKTAGWSRVASAKCAER